MIRAVLNLALALGYFLGVVLVWIGIEMYAVDHARFAPSVVSVIVGIAIWWALASFGRALRPASIGQGECGQ